MRSLISTVFFLAVFVMTADVASAGGKPPGAMCHVGKSCSTKVCVRLHPEDKFGVCCQPKNCPELSAQCGTIDDGCGTPIECGGCDPGSFCDGSNQCVSGSTTTTTSTTTTSTTSTSTTTSSTTSTTAPPPSSTTTSTTSTTTSTIIDSCDDHFCGSSALCNTIEGCYVYQTPENSCGVCVHEISCAGPPNCDSSSDCAPGQKCIINTCCPNGYCSSPCTPN
ncbi:MAG TPA: hypothetical protein VN634_09755 [Candidatus Limnocylindrales bacterium]|nr:hypothetical protein [Candidatus Limnocylindrales bacterium]